MLRYYNVHVTKNRGKNSRFPERHWVASSMIYAFHPTTFFQLGVYTEIQTVPWESTAQLSYGTLLILFLSPKKLVKAMETQ